MSDILYRLAVKQLGQLRAALEQPLVRRAVIDRITPQLSSGSIKVIIGPRRSGKSTLVAQLLQGESFAYFNFDEAEISRELNTEDLLDTLHRVTPNPRYYFFDEIQNLQRWELFLNSLQRSRKNIIVTGSNSNLLSRELASSLTGRHLSFELLPFSYSEYRAAREFSCAAKQDQGFQAYLRHGGFPEVALQPDLANAYLSSLFDSVILRDIVARYRLRRPHALRTILELLLASVGSRYSANSLVRGSGGIVSVPAAIRFVNYAEAAYLFRTLGRLSLQAKRRIRAERKIYAVDNGFLSAKKVSLSEDLAVLLENAVFVELMRRGFEPDFSLFYCQSKGGYEVDFLVREGNSAPELIQVCVTLRAEKTLARELRGLACAAQEVGAVKQTIITMNENTSYREGGRTVNVVSAARWIEEKC